MPSRRNLIFASSVLAVALLTGGTALWFAGDGKLGPIASGKALVGGPFELTNQDGERVKSSDFAGKYMLVVFGYTYCPDICPSELQVVSAALDELGATAERIQPLFVTIDPSRDTPPVLKDYVANFHPGMLGLTGSEEDIARVGEGLSGLLPQGRLRPGPTSPISWTTPRWSISWAPDGDYVTHFAYGTNVASMVEGLRKASGQLTSRIDRSQRPGCWACHNLVRFDFGMFARFGRKRGAIGVLYQLYEMNHAAVAPWRVAAGLSRAFWRLPTQPVFRHQHWPQHGSLTRGVRARHAPLWQAGLRDRRDDRRGRAGAR